MCMPHLSMSSWKGFKGCFWRGSTNLQLGGNCTIDINDSCVFPIRIIDSDKCLPVDDIEWKAKLEAFKQKLPAAIDLLSQADCQELEIDGGLPSLLNAGDFLPDNIVAVVRPCSFNNGNSSKRLDQKFIVRDNQEMILEIDQTES
ncbi:structural maintenance of chromosomes flexible hinge domain-containing protein GMI1-like [Salvia hispanica]|uniref:structural maintenance of chromosomes flexible hinge domain-containing protein GMI1-like n=1 Tax=Salvia hispanica TaxID=49212 RepID=UPI0020090DFB|nr:structural maintenance of chromosomes flexible hinge domain-containing protein GMI1-like [Salvia hispanica]